MLPAGYGAGYDAQVVDCPMASAAPTGEMRLPGQMGAGYGGRAAEDGNDDVRRLARQATSC